MSVEIRPAGPGDASVIALLGRVTFAETFGGLFTGCPGALRDYLDTTFGVAKVRRSLGKPENVYWLAFLEGLPVGYAKLKYPSPLPGQPGRDAAQLQKIYVLREFLGQRIGADLLCCVLREASRRAPAVWLDVLRENEWAIAFYEKHRFAAVGDDTHTIGAQSFRFHLMARHLS